MKINKLRKVLVTLLTASMVLGCASVTALAAGSGQTKVHIHELGGLGDNKDEVEITVGDKTYYGKFKCDGKVEIEMNSTANGFDIEPGGSIEIQFTNTTKGTTTTVILTHKEGNGDKIDKEHDKGKNNFNGAVKTPQNNDDNNNDDNNNNDNNNNNNNDNNNNNNNNNNNENNKEKPKFKRSKSYSLPYVSRSKMVKIEEEPAPLAPEPVVEIPEEDVILSDIPETGSITGLFAASAVLSGLGVAVIGRKKDNE